MTLDLPDCPECDRRLAPADRGSAVCHNCSTRYDLGQCEQCGDRLTEPEATVTDEPGATLWFCPDCSDERGRES